MRERLARLLDRRTPRLPEELYLAEAVCALRWPKRPAYRGGVDLLALEGALRGFPLDAPTLSWLGSREFARLCQPGGRES